MTTNRLPEPRHWRAWPIALALAFLALALPACVTVQSTEGGFSMGGNVYVEEGEVYSDEIVVLGGMVRIDGEARRDIVVIGGTLVVNGQADGDVTAIGGTMRLGPDARIRGDAVNVGGSMNRSPGAEIEGELVNIGIAGLDRVPFIGGPSFGFGDWWGLSPLRVMWRTTQLIYWLLLALLTVALVGDRVSSSAHSIAREPLRLGLIGIVGFFALFALLLVLIVLSVLLIGIPFLLALLLGWWLAYIFGMVAVFQVIGGKVLSVLGKHDSSQLGLVLTGALVLNVLHYFPFIGTLLWILAAFVGLGAVFATRFGTNRPWVGGDAPAPPPSGGWQAPMAPMAPVAPVPPASVTDSGEGWSESPIETAPPSGEGRETD